MRKLIKLLFIFAVLMPLFTLGSWLGVEYAFEKTSDAPFCTSCHTMQPMGETFKLSVHGGNNKAGFKAQCNDCHLPHDNAWNYLITKVRMGSHDLLTQHTGEPDQIDWTAKLEHSDQFVYASGCLHCHKKLEETSPLAHSAYFSGAKVSCLTCHKGVGHPGLASYLKTGALPAPSPETAMQPQ